MNLMKKYLGLIIILIVGYSLLLISISFEDKVIEEFVITDIHEQGIKGEILSSTSGMMGGEGIYLENDYLEDNNLSKLKLGDKIKVTYAKEDYENNIWDNILKIKELQ
jgi:hypothetical protein